MVNIKRNCNSKYGILLFLIMLLLIVFNNKIIAATSSNLGSHFYVLPLGTSGGEMDSNLSSYLVTADLSKSWIALDAGTLCSEIKKISIENFKKLGIHPQLKEPPKEPLAEYFFTQRISTYLISHAHLDHINGLVICSTADGKKEILGLDSTINYLRDYIFNWKIWPNFANEGLQPQLNKYHYHRLDPGLTVPVPKTTIAIKPFILSHGPNYQSTAFLLEANGHYLLYFGDTGADRLEHSDNIQKIWREIAPLVREHKISAIFIEVSYPNERPDNLLFGHLTPAWLLKELHELANLVNPQQPKLALRELKIVITHMKQGFNKQEISKKIMQQLNNDNDLKIEFIAPEPGQLMIF